eukprot:2949607-Amphidinium_carterae.1
MLWQEKCKTKDCSTLGDRFLQCYSLGRKTFGPAHFAGQVVLIRLILDNTQAETHRIKPAQKELNRNALQKIRTLKSSSRAYWIVAFESWYSSFRVTVCPFVDWRYHCSTNS